MIAGTTNEDYVVKATVRNLEKISIAENYLTDVRKVQEPDDIGPDDVKEMVGVAQEGATLFVFGRSSRPGTRYLSATRDAIILSETIIGILKLPTNAKSGARRLFSDVYRRMTNNPRLNFDGGTGTNAYCQDTEWLGVDYEWGGLTPGMTVAAFESLWDVTFLFPRATG